MTKKNLGKIEGTIRTVVTRRDNGTVRVQTFSDAPSKTDQSFKKDCDVNAIMARFTKTGQISHMAKGSPAYHDVTDVPDLDEALNTVAKAQEAFDALPATIRRKFGNSPTEMVNFLVDPNNSEEAFKLGLLSETTLKNLAPPSTLAGENPVREKNNKNKKALNDDKSNDDEMGSNKQHN